MFAVKCECNHRRELAKHGGRTMRHNYHAFLQYRSPDIEYLFGVGNLTTAFRRCDVKSIRYKANQNVCVWVRDNSFFSRQSMNATGTSKLSSSRLSQKLILRKDTEQQIKSRWMLLIIGIQEMSISEPLWISGKWTSLISEDKRP